MESILVSQFKSKKLFQNYSIMYNEELFDYKKFVLKIYEIGIYAS